MLPLFPTAPDIMRVSLKVPLSSSVTSPNNNVLSNRRIELFLADKVLTANAAFILKPELNATAEATKLAAEKRKEAELLAVDGLFNQPTIGTT